MIAHPRLQEMAQRWSPKLDPVANQKSDFITSLHKIISLINTCLGITAVCAAVYILVEHVDYKQHVKSEMDGLKIKIEQLEKGTKKLKEPMKGIFPTPDTGPFFLFNIDI